MTYRDYFTYRGYFFRQFLWHLKAAGIYFVRTITGKR
jgi:hypothetical protein